MSSVFFDEDSMQDNEVEAERGELRSNGNQDEDQYSRLFDRTDITDEELEDDGK